MRIQTLKNSVAGVATMPMEELTTPMEEFTRVGRVRRATRAEVRAVFFSCDHAPLEKSRLD